MILQYAYWITQTLLAIGILCAVYRVYRGPSVLDRVISVDVILIIVASIMLADMAYREHQDFIVFVVVAAVIGFLGAVAIARYAVVRTPDGVPEGAESAVSGTGSAVAMEPEAPAVSAFDTDVPSGPETSTTADESTSWFAALARSGFRPRSREEEQKSGEGEQKIEGQHRNGGERQ